MPLRLTNTLTRQKEVFAPLHPPKVGLYVCGVTVYDYSHVGHARVYVFFDVVQRLLRRLGYDLTYVRNFTDVDDKIIRRANENGEDVFALTERFIEAFHADMARLDCQPPEIEPRVTTHMAEIVALIGEIVGRGHGYAVEGEHGTGQDVYFDVASFEAYGALSRRTGDDNQEGGSERVAADARKRSPADFALWKSAKPGEPWWESPWGRGRPGWHIECSAMAHTHLGTHFDLHGGGRDLVFPHHENEVAQSRAATGAPFAARWMHLAFLTIDAEKMSKSLGNFFTIRDVLARFHPQTLRYFLLTAHYLHPLNFSDRALDEANRRVLAVYEKLAAADAWMAQATTAPPATAAELPLIATARAEFEEALLDDVNTPRALAALSEPITALGAALERPKAAGAGGVIAQVRGFVRACATTLGLFQHDPVTVVDSIVDGVRQRRFPAGSPERAHVEELVAERTHARLTQEWARADGLRGDLLALGVEVRDAREGTRWRPVLIDASPPTEQAVVVG